MIVKRGTRGSMYAGCSLRVYINQMQSALHKTKEEKRQWEHFTVTFGEYIQFVVPRDGAAAPENVTFP